MTYYYESLVGQDGLDDLIIMKNNTLFFDFLQVLVGIFNMYTYYLDTVRVRVVLGDGD